MIEALFLAAYALLASVMGQEPTTVVLLPESDGKVGAVQVSSGGTNQVLDKAYFAVDAAAGSAPTAPRAFGPDEVQTAFAGALAAEPETPRRFLLYFQSGTAELIPEARAMLPEIVTEIRRRPGVDISIIGHSDTVGNDAINARLSLQRAVAVRDLLVSNGMDAARALVRSHGEKDLLIPTGDNVAEPRNRRVEVSVR